MFILFLLIFSKGTVLSGQEIRAIVTEYVKTNELISADNKR